MSGKDIQDLIPDNDDPMNYNDQDSQEDDELMQDIMKGYGQTSNGSSFKEKSDIKDKLQNEDSYQSQSSAKRGQTIKDTNPESRSSYGQKRSFKEDDIMQGISQQNRDSSNDDDDVPMQKLKTKKYDASFVTPPDEVNNRQTSMISKQKTLFDNDEKRPRTQTSANILATRKVAVRGPNTEKSNDMIDQIDLEEHVQDDLLEDGQSMMDNLLGQVDQFQEERQGEKSLNKTNDAKDNSFVSDPSADQNKGSKNVNFGLAKANARFSTFFDDNFLKSSLVQTHSMYKRRGSNIRKTSSGGDTSQPDVSVQVEEKKEQLANSTNQELLQDPNNHEDSLDTEEDLNNYLEELEETDKKVRQSQNLESLMNDERPESKEYQKLDRSTGKSISNISKISGAKDAIDVIQEVEGEDDENFLNSDESFTKEFYQTMHQDVLMNSMTPQKQRRSLKIREITKDDWDYKDLVKMIDWNERRYQEMAKSKLKENSVLSIKNQNTSDIRIRTFTNFINLNSVSKKMVSERSFSKARATCIGLSEDLLMIGNTEGQLWMFDRDSEEDYANFSEKSKEFVGNSVSAIDVHPTRTEYVVLGYERGQMVLIDVTQPKKSIKTIKDHHKLSGIVNIKFVDWYGNVPTKNINEAQTEQTKKEILQEEDKQAWMFISIDQAGRVVINTVQKAFLGMKAQKHVIIDPTKQQVPTYTSISCRFKSKFHGIGEYDDIPIFALGNNQEVHIMEARPNMTTEFMTLKRPNRYFNRSRNDFEAFQMFSPSLSWGHGHSPVLKERPHSLLAVSWGPLIQLVVIIDHDDIDSPIIEDGYYILRNFNIGEQKLIKTPRVRRSVRFANDDRDDTYSFNQSTQEDSKKIDSIQNSRVDEKEIFFEEVYDDSQAFNIPSLFIEQIQFVSDSTLMVITQSQEIRILYTQSFNPEVYDPEKIQQQEKNSYKKSVRIVPKVFPEIEIGIKLPLVQRSEFGGGTFNQTIKFFESKLVILTSKNIQACNHLTWQESVQEFKRYVQDDLIKVFSRLLDIYKGKIKGFSGIPDNATIREIQLKAGLKLNVREIICEKIEKTYLQTQKVQNQINQQLDSSKSPEDQKKQLQALKEFQEDRRKRYQTLIRISIEFCVELKDCYFLFYDLFLLFKEEQLEDLFIEELEPFILAGKFQEWEIPNDILQEHVINYYKNDPTKGDQLEKIIVNLNFNQIEKKIVLEFIHFSEQNFLSTAILFLYTQVIEKKDVLCSLFDLYKKCSKQNSISVFDLQMLKEFDYDSEEKRQIEKSQLYLGYKILWAIRLFIDGKKFPQGNIRERKWRSYIHDVIQFLSTHEYIKVLLDIDAETLFQVISILFYPSKPFELVQQGRDIHTNPNLFSLTHVEFLKDLDAYCMLDNTPENIKNQYLFFVANVVAKTKIHGISVYYYYKITKELMSRHRRYLEFNKNLHEMSNKKKKKITEQLSKSNEQVILKQQQQDELRYIQKTENDLINLIKLSEPLDNIQIAELLKMIEYSEFNQVKVYLLEKKQEYIKCLQMLLNDYKVNEAWTTEHQAERVISWIKEKLALLEEKSVNSIQDKTILEQFKREVTQNIKKIVVMNAKETINLIEEKFGANHKEMIDLLSRDPMEQMLYLETLLEEQDQNIQETIKSYGLRSTNPQEAKRYIDFLKLHLKLCCQLNKDKVLSIVEKMVKHSYFPIQDCLQICVENGQIEAAFLLNKKLGKYFDSVKQGIQIIKNKTNLTKLKIEIYFAHKKQDISLTFPINHDYMTECTTFDTYFKQILQICKKNSNEVELGKEEEVWFIVIDLLQEMRNNEVLQNKRYCREFFQKRINLFLEALIKVIPFKNFINHVLLQQEDLQFKEFEEIILQLFQNNNSESLVLQNANNAIYKVNTELFQQFSQQTMKGILFRQRACFICKKFMDTHLFDEIEDTSTMEDSLRDNSDDEDIFDFYDSSKEQIKVFACKHTYHIKCLKKHYKEKYDEVDEIYMRRVERLRCPKCNLKNYDIDTEKKFKQQPQRGLRQYDQQQNASAKQLMEANHSSGISLSDDPLERKAQAKQIRQTMKIQSLKNRQLQKISKLMNYFEGQKESEGLMIKDFR